MTNGMTISELTTFSNRFLFPKNTNGEFKHMNICCDINSHESKREPTGKILEQFVLVWLKRTELLHEKADTYY